MLTYRGQAVSAGDLVEMRTLVVDMIREQHLDKSVISGKQIFKDMLTYWLAAKSS
jgi:deoxyhypusine synthase